MIQKTGKVNDLFAEELAKRMGKKAALESTETRLDEQRKDMDREPLGKTTEQGLGAKGSDRTGVEDPPSTVEKKLVDKKLPTENSKLQGITEKRLDTASTTPYPHRNPEAWERTGDARPVNNLPAEQGEASDEKRAERFEKSDKAAKEKKERILDKDVGKQLTNKKAFNLKAIENEKKYAKYVPYLHHKGGSGPYSTRVAELKDIDVKLAAIMDQNRELNASEQRQVSELKTKKANLLGLREEPVQEESSIGKRPQVGQTIDVHNMTCKISVVHKAGTIDCECPDGKTYRLTGLGFI